MVWSAHASAAPPDADRLKAAAEEFDNGRRAYKVKDFENAAAYFESADRDAPSPEALRSAIRARKEAGQVSRAATLAALALARYPADKAIGDYAHQVLTESERQLHRLNVACSPECSLVVDSKVMPFPDSTSAVIYLDPGAHAVSASWSGNRHKSSDVTAVAGTSTKISFAAPSLDKAPVVTPDPVGASATTPPEPTAPPPEGGDQGPEAQKKSGLPPAVFLVGAGVTAVLGGITIWSGIDTTNNPGKEKVQTDCKGFTSIDDCPTYQLGLDHERRTNILIATTSVVGVTTAVIGLFFTSWGSDEPTKPEKKDALLMPVFGLGNGVNIGAVGRF